jgi:nucleoside-diphosphate-sugar epimerase
VATLLSRSTGRLAIYNVTDGAPVTWNDYFGELEKFLGRKATVAMSAAAAMEHSQKWLRPSLARRVARKLNLVSTVHPLDENAIRGYTSKAVYSNQRLGSDLAFRPTYSLSEGIRNPTD